MHQELRKIKKWERSAPNRLKSIEEDARRVNSMLTSLCWDVFDALAKAEVKKRSKAPNSTRQDTSSAQADSDEAHVILSSSGANPLVQIRCFANLRCGEWYLPSCSLFRGGGGGGGQGKGGLPGCNTHLPEHVASVLRGYKAEEADGSIGLSGSSETAHHFTLQPSPNVYFKSADSHYGKWQFSAVRLNLQLLMPYLIDTNAAPSPSSLCDTPRIISVIVDATQQGKRFPDALSKTVPIWCLVVNEALFYKPNVAAAATGESENCDAAAQREDGRDAMFQRARAMLPPWVPDSECNSIALLLPSFVKVFEQQFALNGNSIRSKRLARPLKPQWVSCADDAAAEEALGEIGIRCAQRAVRARNNAMKHADTNEGDAFLSSSPSSQVDHDVIVLMCASGDTTKVRPRGGWFYVTGGADDHESWGRGLSPSLFWDHVDSILYPNGRDAAMPPDAMIVGRMEEVIETHAEKCRQLAEGNSGAGATGSSSSHTESLSSHHKWFPICANVAVHCGPLPIVTANTGIADGDGGSGDESWHVAMNAMPPDLFGSHVDVKEAFPSLVVVGPSPAGATDTIVSEIVSPSHALQDRYVPPPRILFDVNNKTGFQRAAHALFVAASAGMLQRGTEEGCANADTLRRDRHCPLLISVAIPEHIPIAVAVLSLLMTLMTSRQCPDVLRPLLSIERRLREDVREGDDVRREVGGTDGIGHVIEKCVGAVSECICERNAAPLGDGADTTSATSSPITKEWIRSCHQRASALVGGITAPRSLMQQANQYFLTMDSFGKNVY